MPLKKGVKCRTQPKKDGGTYTHCFDDKSMSGKTVKFKRKEKKDNKVEKAKKLAKELTEKDGRQRRVTAAGIIEVKGKPDNLKKAVGISRKEANKMDFGDLMKHLPEDIRKNIGGHVKGDRTAEHKEFLDAVKADHQPLDWEGQYFFIPEGGEIMQGREATKHGFLSFGTSPTELKEKNEASFKRKLANLYFKKTGKRMKFRNQTLQQQRVVYLIKVSLARGVPKTAIEDAYSDYKWFQTRTNF